MKIRPGAPRGTNQSFDTDTAAAKIGHTVQIRTATADRDVTYGRHGQKGVTLIT